MSLIVTAKKPGEFYAKMKRYLLYQIISNWELLPNGLLSMTEPPKDGVAFFRGEIRRDELHFGIVSADKLVLLPEVYSYYHSRLVEMLLDHFENDFTGIYVSSKRSFPDVQDRSE